MNILDRIKYATGVPLTRPEPEERQDLSAYLAEVMQFGGWNYQIGNGPQAPPGVPSESPPDNFEAMVRQVYYRSGIVAACIVARMSLVMGARLKFRNLDDRSVYGTPALKPLEQPNADETSGTILSRFEQDASLAGNGYRIRIGGELFRPRPDYMHIILGSNMTDGSDPAIPYSPAEAPDAKVVGYAYWPGGKGGKYQPRTFLPQDVAHYAPEPDPLYHFRGMSWITSVLRDVETDRQMTEHKAGFLERGATPSFAIKYPDTVGKGDLGAERQKQIVQMFREQHEGAANSWKALHLFGGADPVSIGTNFRDLDFKSVQGATETRIASRARVPAGVLGISEGLAGSALNAGNFGQQRRSFGEQFFYPSMQEMCAALTGLVVVPDGSELWYDATDVAFLHEDAKDAADVLATQASAIRTLVDGGFEETSVVKAVTGGDLSLLKHTGLVPVQLQPPGTSLAPVEAKAEPPNITVDARTSVATPIDGRSYIDLNELRFSPEVNVAAPEVTVEAAQIEVLPAAPAEVTVNVPELPSRTVRKTVERDEDGQITGVTEEEIRG